MNVAAKNVRFCCSFFNKICESAWYFFVLSFCKIARFAKITIAPPRPSEKAYVRLSVRQEQEKSVKCCDVVMKSHVTSLQKICDHFKNIASSSKYSRVCIDFCDNKISKSWRDWIKPQIVFLLLADFILERFIVYKARGRGNMNTTLKHGAHQALHSDWTEKSDFYFCMKFREMKLKMSVQKKNYG